MPHVLPKHHSLFIYSTVLVIDIARARVLMAD
jgi:hypothetical protein